MRNRLLAWCLALLAALSLSACEIGADADQPEDHDEAVGTDGEPDEDEEEEEVEVPYLGGLSEQRAADTLEGQGLELGEVDEEESDARDRSVIRSEPEHGDTVEAGTAVDLVIAADQTTGVPDEDHDGDADDAEIQASIIDDPDTFADLFLDTVWDEMRDDLIEGFEHDVRWIDAADTLDFNQDDHRLELTVTSSLGGGYYDRNPDNLEDDLWDLYTVWARDFWGGWMDTSEEDGVEYDWPAVMPGLRTEIDGQYAIDCPGESIVEIAEREISRGEFPEMCDVS